MGHGIVFMRVYVALLLEVNVSSDNTRSPKGFDTTLVSANECMISVAAVEAVATAFGVFRREREDANPRIRHKSQHVYFAWNVDTQVYKKRVSKRSRALRRRSIVEAASYLQIIVAPIRVSLSLCWLWFFAVSIPNPEYSTLKNL